METLLLISWKVLLEQLSLRAASIARGVVSVERLPIDITPSAGYWLHSVDILLISGPGTPPPPCGAACRIWYYLVMMLSPVVVIAQAVRG